MVAVTAADRDTAIRTLVGEASNQGAAGLTAVEWVILNRANWTPNAWWGDTVGGVCKKAWQFSCWNGGANTDRINAMTTDDPEYLAAATVFDAAIDGTTSDPTGGATTYKIRGTKASWDVAVQDETPRAIGVHDFWRLDPRGYCLAFFDSPTTEGVANV